MTYDGDPEWICNYIYDKERLCDKNCKGCINVSVYYDSVNKQWMNVCCIDGKRCDYEERKAGDGVLEQIAEKQDSLLDLIKAWDDEIDKYGYVN